MLTQPIAHLHKEGAADDVDDKRGDEEGHENPADGAFLLPLAAAARRPVRRVRAALADLRAAHVALLQCQGSVVVNTTQ